MNDLYASIAKVAHEVNRAYCLALGDNSQKPWDEAPDWQQDSAIAGVHFLDENPDAEPGALHDAWMQQKVEDGWQYGEVKDEELKTHPNIVPFYALPEQQKAKDHIFGAVVRGCLALASEPEEDK